MISRRKIFAAMGAIGVSLSLKAAPTLASNPEAEEFWMWRPDDGSILGESDQSYNGPVFVLKSGGAVVYYRRRDLAWNSIRNRTKRQIIRLYAPF